MFKREKVAAIVAEFFGTAVLTTVVLTVSRTLGYPYFVGIAAGLTLMIIVSMIGNISGAHVNPAVTLSLWTVKKINTIQAILYVAVQCAGALVAFRLLSYLTGSTTDVERAALDWKVFTAEAVGAFVFIFGIASAIYQKYEGGRLASVIGGSLFVGVLVASPGSFAVLNPAIALAVVWSTPYFVAPIVGGILAANIYAMLFAGEKFTLSTINARIGAKTAKKAPAKKAKKAPAKKAKTTKRK
jgi:glycerol uptake facilitator-like aquaporin